MTKPCSEGICRDNDGRSASMCDCSKIKHLARDCTVERAFDEACHEYHGTAQQNEQGEWVCSCPFGTKFNGFGCESYACGLQELSCQNICNNKFYREDKRCCQGWDNGCDAYYMEGTYCKPGTIPAGKKQNNLNCTNVCAMGGDACEYYCTYKDAKSPYYTCTCPDGKVLNDDGYTCREKNMCEDHEESDCKNRGQRCVVEERRAVCKCPSGQILFNGGCRASCTPAKTATCTTILSHCEIIDDVETCVCDSPLIWDEAEKKCLLEKQFVYEMHFEMNKHPKVHFEEWGDNMALKIQRAMKNLYGTSLRKTKFNQRGKTSVIELNFADEPEKALLNRIFQCQEFEAPGKCFFAPDLYIVNGTATTATSIDLCDMYLRASSLATKHGLECYNEGKGEYSLRCRGKNSQPPAKYGALTVVRCDAKTECDDHEKEECTKKGQRCVVENRRAVCKCPAEQILVDGVCRASCTEPKKSTCATILSRCKIIDNVETCVCDRPLIWNEAEKKCVLERQFIYQMQFEMDQHRTVHTQAWCDNAQMEIDHAMKNLYGKSLRRAEVVQCWGTPTIEVNFAEEPGKALLNRIFQCQEHDSPDKCYFAPDLYIVKGTVKAPASVDICTRYLQESSLFEKEGLICQNDGNGEYSLRCRGKNSLPPAKYGALTVVQCEGGPNAAERFTSTTAALLIGILIPAVLV